MITLQDSTEIRTTPEQVFNWFTNLRNGEDYRAWHPNHVDWYWIKGETFQEGSIVYSEEYIHGNKDRLRLICTKVVSNRLIEYKPSFPISILMSKSQYVIESKDKNSCVFTAAISFREVPHLKKLFNEQIEALKKHMKEEGAKLKMILKSEKSS